MKFESCEKRNVTTEQAIKLFEEQGCHITENEAEKILDILYFLSKLIVNQEIKNEDSGFIHKGEHRRAGG
ncbi:hypothetical protein GCM10023313_07970 [Mucilaginibacter defluvii]|uniref:Uncharacterized protein n=2 Tax=Mucilaginibacter defluvii TaxID=1196019 RepID=A0ABP9FMF5_9SPHI